MKLTLERPGRLPIVVSVADDQERQGKAILAKLAELDARGPELKEGSTIDFGWSRLTLEDGYDELRLHGPILVGTRSPKRLP